MIPNQNKPREHFESFAIALRLALISIFSMSLAKLKSKVELAALMYYPRVSSRLRLQLLVDSFYMDFMTSMFLIEYSSLFI
jgi:hypothetical protein